MTNRVLRPLPPEKGTWDRKSLDRRAFLEGAFAVLAGVGALAVTIPGVRFLVGNSLAPPTTKWVPLGSTEELPSDGSVARVNYGTRAIDAWREVTKTGTVYVFSDDDGASYVALDGTCTHLGCIVQWREDEEHFGCPCHSGFFTREGQVISGPPPRPLLRLPVKIEGDIVFAEI
jgi:Rieske Fe-S protein